MKMTCISLSALTFFKPIHLEENFLNKRMSLSLMLHFCECENIQRQDKLYFENVLQTIFI